MLSLNKILHLIKENHTSFNITDDYKVDDEIILDLIHSVRATLIREEFILEGFISMEYYQMNCCYTIECKEVACDYDGVEIDDGKEIQYVKLKSHIKKVRNLAIKYIGDSAGTPSARFNLVNYNEFISSDGRVWTKFSPLATVVGNELLLKNLPTAGMKFICILELLNNPTTACDWTDDSDYPVPSSSKLVDMVTYRLMNKTNVPDDKLNNASDDAIPPRIASDAAARQQRLQSDGNETNQERR